MILLHGNVDNIVPVAQAHLFDEALTKAGVPHQLLLLGGGHGLLGNSNTGPLPETNPNVIAVDTFLANYLKTP